MGLVIISVTDTSKTERTLRGQPAFKPNVYLTLLVRSEFGTNQIQTPQKTIQATLIDGLARGLVDLRPGENVVFRGVQVLGVSGKAIGHGEKSELVGIAERLSSREERKVVLITH